MISELEIPLKKGLSSFFFYRQSKSIATVSYSVAKKVQTKKCMKFRRSGTLTKDCTLTQITFGILKTFDRKYGESADSCKIS